MAEFSTLIGGLSFTECPRWHDGRLYVTDRYTRRVLAIAEDGTAEAFAHTPGLPAGIGFLPDGRLLIASMLDRKIVRREPDGSLVEHADLSSFAQWQINDMLVDHQGRAWVGQFGFDLFGGAPARTTTLLRVMPDGSTAVVAEQLGFPNGIVLTSDRRTLIVAETTMNRLSAFTITGDTLSQRRNWAAFGEPSMSTAVHEIAQHSAVMPDGICLDAEGAVWVADVTHQRVIRVIEGGAVVEERKTDGVSVFACMLGGHDGRTLFTCAAPTFDDAEASTNHRASILTTRVDVPHAGLP